MSAVFEKPLGYIEYEDYLVLERASQYKHEYLDGVIYAVQGDGTRGMAGGSQTHARLIRNTLMALHRRLAGTPCEALASDMALRIEAANAVFYPDVLVHCSATEDPGSTFALDRARLVVEVLSQHTQRFDGGSKLAAYRRAPGLQHILLISGLAQSASACHRSGDDQPWSPMVDWPRGSTLALPGLGIELPWEDVFSGSGLP
jgi:Uma2 family endonuclease